MAAPRSWPTSASMTRQAIQEWAANQLVACYCLNRKALRDDIMALTGHLAILLPRYMVPTLFVPCAYMPVVTSGKLDRAGLKNAISSLSWEDLAAYALRGDQKRAPETPMECRLQLLWAEILNIPAEGIGRDDSFLRIGGDSIAVIHLTIVARDAGILSPPRMSSTTPVCGKLLPRQRPRKKEAMSSCPTLSQRLACSTLIYENSIGTLRLESSADCLTGRLSKMLTPALRSRKAS